MDLEKIITDLKGVACSLGSHVAASQWYVFGSTTRHKKLPADIDVLIVYEKDSDVQKLRLGLEALGRRFPLHVLFLRADEERELKFVAEQAAIRIFP
jgi:predicted nucleotidyltransferase